MSDGIESQARRKAVLLLTVDDNMSHTEQALQTGVEPSCVYRMGRTASRQSC